MAHLKVISLAGKVVEFPTSEMTTIGDVKTFLTNDPVILVTTNDSCHELKDQTVPTAVGAAVRTQSGLVLSDGDSIQMIKVGTSAEIKGPKGKTSTRRIDIIKETLRAFKHNATKEKMYLPTHDSYDRSLAHEAAAKFGLHTSTKNGTRLFVTRHPPYDGSGNDGETCIRNYMNSW